MPTTNAIDRELTEANELTMAKHGEELLDSELATVTGGLNSFQWGVGRAIGTASRGAAA